jgi:ferredoxin
LAQGDPAKSKAQSLRQDNSILWKVTAMIRKIIDIDEHKCNGCGLCLEACHEGAIGLRDGKARLLRADYCDGLGNCLPACPSGAISFVEREAEAFNEAAAKNAMQQAREAQLQAGCNCPGAKATMIARPPAAMHEAGSMPSQLRQWPIQIKLVPVTAPYFANAQLLIAADCAAYAYAGFHADFMRGAITLIGCPKLDEVNYSRKLAALIAANSITSLAAVRMQVPCCAGIADAAMAALKESGKKLPWRLFTISVNGQILETETSALP